MSEKPFEAMTTNQRTAAISCRHVWKIFGPAPARVLGELDDERSKARVLDETGHVVAVRDVSFEVFPGEIFVVMGLSGSGKSTLLRCLSRLIDPTRGEVWVDGENVTQMDGQKLRHLRRHKMSMVFQNFGLFPHRRIIDNVAYGLEVQGMKRRQRYARALKVLELVNLVGWESHYPGQLSGGMQQRVGLARALAVDPEILLFDEPFSALDPLIRREMQDELLGLHLNMRKTLVFITHDFAEAIKLGDRIAIMKDGVFVQVGTPEEVVLQPVNRYVADFTQDVPKSKVLTARSVMRPVADDIAGLHSVSARTKLEELIPLLAENDVSLLVVDDSEQLLGCVDRSAVMRALRPSTTGQSAQELAA